MTIISLEHTKSQVRGYLTRFMLEARPGVFVGILSKRTRDMLTETIKQADPDVDMVVAYKHESRIKLESYGRPTRKVSDFENLQLLTRVSKKQIQLYEQILGKPNKTLLSHCLDAGYVCEYLLSKATYKILARQLADATDVSITELICILSYICAMHDVGKLHPFFQAKLFDKDCSVKEDIERIYGSEITGYEGYRHEYGSYEILTQLLKEEGVDRKVRKLIGMEVWAHHQGHKKGCVYSDIAHGINSLPVEWKDKLMTPFCTHIKQVFMPDISVMNKIFTDIPVWAFDSILGIIMTCDWIASGRRFMDIDVANFQTAEEYKEKCLEIIEEFTKQADLSYRSIEKQYGYNNLFGINTPRTMQETVAQAVKEHPMFDCMLIEAPMGEGKTEASLYAAVAAMKERKMQGIYFALPAGLTSEAMLPRLSEMLRHIGENDNVRLATGTAWLSDLNDDMSYQDMIMRRYKLIDRYCVGTVDQIMSAATLSYYAEIKMAALGSKVIVIDEVHSYDTYMMSVIRIMLKYFKSVGVPVIMLSATLSDRARAKLLSCYGLYEQEHTLDYPKISVIEGDALHQYKSNPSDRKSNIKIVVKHGKLNEFYCDAVNKVKGGGCLAFIVNSVDNAVKTCKEIQQTIQEQGLDTKVYLLHAQAPMSIKENKIKELVQLFGKNRENRPASAIVVATPIIEMSMDLDFDFMYRQIAPVDAVIQSMGRIARHEDIGTIRENGIRPELILMVTDDGNRIYAGQNYKKGDAISILDVTAKVLSGYEYIHLPSDVPELINKVYDDRRLDDYYDEQMLSEIAGSVVTSSYEPQASVSYDLIKEDLKEKTVHPMTRESSVEYIKVAVMDDKQLKVAKTGNVKEIRELYKDTVVNIPAWKIQREIILVTGEGLELSKWFSDVYIDGDGKYFKLDHFYGLQKL